MNVKSIHVLPKVVATTDELAQSKSNLDFINSTNESSLLILMLKSPHIITAFRAPPQTRGWIGVMSRHTAWSFRTWSVGLSAAYIVMDASLRPRRNRPQSLDVSSFDPRFACSYTVDTAVNGYTIGSTRMHVAVVSINANETSYISSSGAMSSFHVSVQARYSQPYSTLCIVISPGMAWALMLCMLVFVTITSCIVLSLRSQYV